MKVKTLVLTGAATLLTAQSLFATIYGSGTLTITAKGLPDVNGPYTAVTDTVLNGPNLGTIYTFCIGSQVDYYSGDTYTYQISDQVQPFATAGSGGLSYISLGTAWLYSQYAKGDIGGGTVNGSANDALQQAIWYLQGQSGGQLNSDITTAETTLGKSLAQLEANGNDAYNVYALDLSPGNAPGDVDGYAQPQLCIDSNPVPQGGSVPEPSTIFAGVLLLLPLGVGVARTLRKQRA
jgi:hypothetical protein